MKGQDYERLSPLINNLEGLMEILLLFCIHKLVIENLLNKNLQHNSNSILMFSLLYCVIGFFLMSSLDAFRFGFNKISDNIGSQIIILALLNVAIYLQAIYLEGVFLPIRYFVLILILQTICSIICTIAFTSLHNYLARPITLTYIYGGQMAFLLKEKLDRQRNFSIKHVVRYEEGIEAIIRKIRDSDAVLINDIPTQVRNDVMKYCYGHGIITYFVPKISDVLVSGAQGMLLYDTPIKLIEQEPLNINQRIIKRCMDVFLTSIALIPAIPIMVIIAIAIKLEDGGPILFIQKRVTKDNKIFPIYKFRSMSVDSEKFGEVVPTMDKDPRITKVGKFIRPIRFDELPQLFNILKGEMSIVGPRPERIEHVQKYTDQIPEFSFRHKVKGGLTGYAQIFGKYNTLAYDKLRLDLRYIQNYSLALDLKIILLTVKVLLSKESTEGFDQPPSKAWETSTGTVAVGNKEREG